MDRNQSCIQFRKHKSAMRDVDAFQRIVMPKRRLKYKSFIGKVSELLFKIGLGLRREGLSMSRANKAVLQAQGSAQR